MYLIKNISRALNDADSDQCFLSNIRRYTNASLSENTRRAYRNDLNHFFSNGGHIPASAENVATYLADHAELHSVATLRRRLVSIGKAHSAQGLPSPTGTQLVKATMRGIRHTHGSHQRQVTPAIKEDMLLMVDGLTGMKGLRDRALLLVGFAGAFRRSELVSLTIEDIEHVQQGLVIHLRRSKTDQDGIGRKVAIPLARGSVCPVQALQSWLQVANIKDGPIFRAVNRGGAISNLALSPQVVALIVKNRAHAIGLDARKYSGHSLRAGLVTSAARLGASSWKIRQQTGHKTDAMLARYIRDANIFIDNAAGIVL